MKKPRMSAETIRRRKRIASDPIPDLIFNMLKWNEGLFKAKFKGRSDDDPIVLTMKQYLAELTEELQRREGGGIIIEGIMNTARCSQCGSILSFPKQ